MVKVGDEFLAVYTKYDIPLISISEAFIPKLEESDIKPLTDDIDKTEFMFLTEERKYKISKIDCLLEGVKIIHYRVN